MKKNTIDKLSSKINRINEFIMSYSSFIIGALLLLGLILHLISDTIHNEFSDQGIVVFNLLGAFLLFIYFSIKILSDYLGTERKNKPNKIYAIIYIILLVISIIIGHNIQIKSLLFTYNYKGIFSSIAIMSWTSIIFFYIYTLINSKENKEEPKNIVLNIVTIFGLTFFIGTILTSILSFQGYTNIYDNIVEYHKTTYNQERSKIDIDKFIKSELKKAAENRIDLLKTNTSYQSLVENNSSQEDLDQKMIELLHSMTGYSNRELTEKGYQIINHKWQDDFIAIFQIEDKEYKNKYLYYKVDYKTFEISKSKEGTYNSIKSKENN